MRKDNDLYLYGAKGKTPCLHDSTLESIAATHPRTLDDLRGISGGGAKKLERYEETLLTITRKN